MFTNTAGHSLRPESISQLFTRLVERSGLPRIRFHDLRHTHASLLVADGVNIKVVSDAWVTRTRHASAPASGFGAGKHFCLGAQMAREITDVAMRRFLQRIPNFSLTTPTVEWNSSSNFRSPVALPLAIH
jgi:hypothetical protein